MINANLKCNGHQCLVVLSFFQETFLAKLIYLWLSVIIYFNKEKTRAGIYSIFCEKCNWILIYKNKQVCQSCSNSKLPTKNVFMVKKVLGKKRIETKASDFAKNKNIPRFHLIKGLDICKFYLNIVLQ